jgi:hypothetical protein
MKIPSCISFLLVGLCCAAAFSPTRTIFPIAVPLVATPMNKMLPQGTRSSNTPILRMVSESLAVEDPNEGKRASNESQGTIPALMFNLVKSIVGAGVLSLPSGKSCSKCHFLKLNYLILHTIIAYLLYIFDRYRCVW